ncbi:hypothetical protein ASPSYDRAFT_162809 [Aspergillus sydowii CBS 593.65]|uniref:C3H1-type domain-containing protein n=1 Tax=Aspergillus sydowii CBS 593.65 TaxID=1036612 RepID=A0A1L9T2B3_9EURO|nr:uncharacterized protein ASPSYDRAFT_162809 [Aspergillus sydowii CBS 593.65]OJJ53604.1 hypothetical protein ASPSYDRAFT_162809 [Aspergillus sydowii CBS 593.65]
MLGDADLKALGGNLKSVSDESQKHHDDLQKLLGQFQFLLDSYNRLKSDYEEEKEGRERYKRLAKTQERNPFVLVLVDGDGYLFKDYLIKAGHQGGVKAAQLLNESIKDLVHERLGTQADECRIMVRIYSNILGLSKSLARLGLVGKEARSFSIFAGGFTAAQDLFDYVDAGDKKEGADYKIREMFRLFADNNQCKHIFFAGCHDTGYLSLLTPYRGKAERITLIKAASFHHDFSSLEFAIRELPSVFMSTQVGGGHVPPSPTVPLGAKICTHYQKGICKYGNQCTKVHTGLGQQLSKSVDNTSPGISSYYTKEPRFATRDLEFYSKTLPYMDTRSLEFIAVNKDGERIDTYVPMPSQDSRDTYGRLAKACRPCNYYHLAGGCETENCEYGHTPLDSNSLSVMKYILRQNACPRGARCRSLKCYLGHICQKDGCRGTKPCKFKPHAHTLDVMVARWDDPIERLIEDSPASEASAITHSMDDSGSVDGVEIEKAC